MTVNRTEERLELTAIDKGARAAIDQVRGSVVGLRTGLDSVNAALGAVGVTVGVGAMVQLHGQIVKATAALDDMAEATGASVENLSKIQQVAKIGGHDFDGLTQQISKMVKGLKSADEDGQKAAHALAAIGVKARDANGHWRDQAEVLIDVAKKLNEYEDGAGKLALVQDALGKGAERYLPLLKDIAEEGDLQAKVTAKQAAEAEKLEKNINRLKLAFEDAKRELALGFTGALIDLTDRLIIAQRAGDLFWQSMIEGARGFMRGMANVPSWAGPAGVLGDAARAGLPAFEEWELNRRRGKMENHWATVGLAPGGAMKDFTNWMEPGPKSNALSTYTPPAGPGRTTGGGSERDDSNRRMREEMAILQRLEQLDADALQRGTELHEREREKREEAERRMRERLEHEERERIRRIEEERIRSFERQRDSLADALTQGAVDGFMRGLERDESIFRAFTRTLKNILATTVLTAAIRPVMLPLAGAVTGLMGSLFGGGGGLGSILTNGGGIGGGLGNGLGSFMNMGAQTFADFGNFFGSIGATTELGGTFGLMDAIGGFAMANPLATAGLVLGGASLLGGLFGDDGNDAPPGYRASNWLRLNKTNGSYSVESSEIPDPGAMPAIAAALNASLNDASRYDPSILDRYVGQTVSGGPGTGSQALADMMLKLVAPAAEPLLKAARELEEAAQKQKEVAALQEEREQTQMALSQQMRALPGALGIDSLEAYGASLRTSEFLSPLDRLAGARSNYDSVLGRALAGDLGAIGGFPDAAQSLLGIGRDVYASSPAFQDLFREVNRALNQVLDQQRGVQADILRSVPIAIQQAANDQIGELRRGFNAMVTKLNDIESRLRDLAA